MVASSYPDRKEIVEAQLVENEARRYIEQNLQALRHFSKGGRRIFGDASPVYEFLLANGQEFHGTPWTTFRGSGYRKMAQRRCFENSLRMAIRDPRLTYYEGFAFSGLIPVHHAWCVDLDGRVVDFTWRKSVQTSYPENEWSYFGIGWDVMRIAKWIAEKPTLSVIFDLDYTDPAIIDLIKVA